MNDDELKELLDFATGGGKWAWTGPYMHTHPWMDDNQKCLHAGCIELERRGLLKRCIDEPGHVSWTKNITPSA